MILGETSVDFLAAMTAPAVRRQAEREQRLQEAEYATTERYYAELKRLHTEHYQAIVRDLDAQLHALEQLKAQLQEPPSP